MESCRAKIMQIKEFSFCVCLILNFINFTKNEHNNNDSLNPINELIKTLEKFKIKVYTKFDLKNMKRIEEEVNRVIEKEKWNDSFMIYINSPAESNGFITSDCHVVEYYKIISYISNHPKLTNKLKFVFFDCVGPQIMVNDLYSKPDRPNNNILEGNESVVCLPTFKGIAKNCLTINFNRCLEKYLTDRDININSILNEINESIQKEYHTNEQTIQYSQFKTRLIFKLKEHSQFKTDKGSKYIRHYIPLNDVYELKENKPYVLVLNVLKCSKWSEESQRQDAEMVNKLVKDTFINLNCEVDILNNCTEEEIFDILKDITQEKIKNYSAFILYITSHGNKKGFECANGKHIKNKKILECFSNQNSEYLIGKPKIILLDFCQNEFKPLTKSDGRGQGTKKLGSSSTKKYSDIFILRSTLEGEGAVRGLFATVMNKVFKEHKRDHLLYVFDKINTEIQNFTFRGHKQSIEYKRIAPNKTYFYFNLPYE